MTESYSRNGEFLARLLYSFHLDATGAAELNYKSIKEIPEINGLVIIGNSASGKTTYINELRMAACAGYFSGGFSNLIFPKRLITRPPRLGDDLLENEYCSRESLINEFSEGNLYVRWTRCMENGRTEEYGFVKRLAEGFPVFFC